MVKDKTSLHQIHRTISRNSARRLESDFNIGKVEDSVDQNCASRWQEYFVASNVTKIKRTPNKGTDGLNFMDISEY
jgi:hypothetical protein